jgi:hypothetical protein
MPPIHRRLRPSLRCNRSPFLSWSEPKGRGDGGQGIMADLPVQAAAKPHPARRLKAAVGELGRRYWHPIAASGQFLDEPTRAIRILGESLVLYKDRSGTFGLIQESCPHRRVNLHLRHSGAPRPPLPLPRLALRRDGPMPGAARRGPGQNRRLLGEQMAIVEDGGDPMNAFRDPARNVSIELALEDNPLDGPRGGGGFSGTVIRATSGWRERGRSPYPGGPGHLGLAPPR